MNGASSSSEDPSGVQGVCPTGWHLPSFDEWKKLVDYVESQGYPNEWTNLNGAGNALKSCRQENSPLAGDCNTTVHPRWAEDKWSGYNHHGFDAFGFSALPGGSRSTDGAIFGAGWNGNWWSATQEDQTSANLRIMDEGGGTVSIMSYNKSGGFSVRCVKIVNYFCCLQCNGYTIGEAKITKGYHFSVDSRSLSVKCTDFCDPSITGFMCFGHIHSVSTVRNPVSRDLSESDPWFADH